MKLTSLKTTNFLSLASEPIADIDPSAVFLVGPSGAGKSNLFRALVALREAFDDAGHVALGAYLANNAKRREVEVAAGVVFETDWERQLIAAFVAAALSNPNEWRQFSPSSFPRSISVDEDRIQGLAEWLLSSLTLERASCLWSGELRASWSGSLGDSIRLSYSFACDDTQVHLLSGTYLPDGRLAEGSLPKRISGSLQATSVVGLFDSGTQDAPANRLIDYLSGVIDMPPDHPKAADLLRYMAKVGLYLTVQPISSNDPEMPGHRALQDLSGEPFVHVNLHRGMRWLFSTLLHRALVATPNQRAPYRASQRYTPELVAAPPSSTADESLVPLLLYRLKNGTAAEQERFRRVQGAFTDLIGNDHSFDLQVRHDQGHMDVDVRIADGSSECSLAIHGAGTWEAVILSTVLLEGEGKVILLDEPAANLHPPMQRRLLKLLEDLPSQVVVATHSPELMPKRAEQLHQILRLTKDGAITVVHRLPIAWKKARRAELELRTVNSAATLLFSRGVIVVEGPTESSAFVDWFTGVADAAGRTADELALSIHSAGGEGGVLFLLELLRAFGVPAAGICDGDALRIGARIRRFLPTIGELENDATFDSVRAKAAEYGIFTFSSDFDGKFETIPAVSEAARERSGSKPADASAVARMIKCPPEVSTVIGSALRFMGLGLS